jgi:TonB family protein
MNRIYVCLTAGIMRRAAIRLTQVAALALIVVFAVSAQASDAREVRSKVAPVYPELAKRMKISGEVKVEAVVSPEGAVTEAKAVAGNRALSAAAEEAVRHWKFAPGSSQSTVELEVSFALN